MTDMSNSPIGKPLQRREDYRFLTGAGQYTDDVVLPGQTFGYFLRSPHAHARIKSIDTSKAAKAAGVVQIFTGADLAEAKVGGLPCGWLIHSKDGSPMKEPPHPVLAQGKVRHVGDQVALIVAETALQAKDAAELIEVDYEELPAVIDITTADKSGAAVHDDVPNNVCYDWGHGNKDAVDAAFKQAAKVSTLEFVNNRLIPNAMEPRAANAHYTKHDDSYTLYVANQNPHVERLLMSAFVLGLPESKVRVIAPDVGGGFGSKIFLYAEETALVWASKRVNRPIKWTAERSESFLTDAHGRDHHTKVELAMDAKGNFLALRVNTIANMGAYLSTFASSVPTILYATLLAGQYKTPAIYCNVKAVFTTTAPVDAYRGAGRPEATYVVERIVEQAARGVRLARDEILVHQRDFQVRDLQPAEQRLDRRGQVAVLYREVEQHADEVDRVFVGAELVRARAAAQATHLLDEVVLHARRLEVGVRARRACGQRLHRHLVLHQRQRVEQLLRRYRGALRTVRAHAG